MPLIFLLYSLVLKPHDFKLDKKSNCVLLLLLSLYPKVYAINLRGIFFVSSGFFCLREPEAAFLGFANLSLILLKSFFEINTSPLTSISLGKLLDSNFFGISFMVFKFSAISSISKILKIEIQIGRTGALTPVAKIQPVNIGGVLVANATLHNEDEIERKDIRVADTVKIERAGDVIPHVVSVDKNKRTFNSKKYIFPEKCPSCGSKTIKEYNKLTKKHDAVRRCLNENFKCERIAIECLKHFVSKEALNIDGFGKKIVEKFWQLKFIKFPQDIFNLDFKKIENLEGWGSLSVSNLKYSIEKAKKINLDRFIFALGIRHIGKENARLLSQHLKNIKNFYNLSNTPTIKNLTNIDGIGETQIKSIKAFFSNKVNITNLEKLIKYMNISDATYSDKDGILKNKTFMFTGKLKEISRAEAKSLVEQNSGKIISNVNKKLNFLIVGEKPTNSKIKKAKELNINILTQDAWIKMLNKAS